MRSVIHETFGDPALVLTTAERPLPEPGPGEVRIRMVLSPIHNHDLWTVRGSYGYKPALPAVGGTEALGIVDAHGEGVTAPAIGQRIVVAGVNGVWSDYFLAPAARVVPIPPEIDDETACQLIAMPLSTLMLLEDIDLSSGQWMIQNAANGAVGKLVATFGRARGIHVVNVVRRDAGIDELAAAGIGNAVSTEQAGWEERVQAITGGQPILRALESVGGEAANQLMGVLAEGGALIAFGSMSGKPLEINSGHLIFKQITVRGFWGAKRSAMTERGDMARMIGELIQMATVGVLSLSVDAIFDLTDAAAAAKASDQPGRSGKIALRGGAA
ncbi:zinc-binding dehydrogenase [Kaistia dalseonensis]|uniref:enoyl-[acyl-carrier-protein] reductase n=1 Tax=Kaistia dalseonensis TaxID=410840 RepID=A0ABU0HBR4_9HYPH|nr:zinc-binding dehydrogenase [Kaistia dalseonensis]MCX5497115.1 zinc-binding dehydrogenase [Kaistia dalseonensis]MDQ0439741.1 NADPH:quinone reductase-like Zn-dependent oxidoreductase [Kaistia dalseonensis]